MGIDVLALRGLNVDFAGGVPALRDVSLTVAPGECVVVLGESGSGKTLTLHAMLGLATPRAQIRGELSIEGATYDLACPRSLAGLRGRAIGLVSQDAGASLTPHLTLRRQLYGSLGTHRGLGGAAREAEARRLLDVVRIPDAATRLGQYPHELSGGLQQRAALALALAPEPRYLFADEPTTALDVTLQDEIVALLAKLTADAGLGIVFVTHDASLVEGLARRMVVMYAGRVVEEGDASLLLGSPRHPYTAALLAARPRLDAAPGTPLVTIPGQPPAPGAWPTGCAFTPRCRRARDVCVREVPVPATGPDARHVACHSPLPGADA